MSTPPGPRRPWASLSGRVALGAVAGLIVAAVLFAAVGVSLIRGEATSQARAELDRQARAVAVIVSERASTALETGEEFSTREPIGNLEELAGPGTRLYYVGLALSPGSSDPTGGLPPTVARDLSTDVLVRDGSQGFEFTPAPQAAPAYAAAAPVLVNGRYLGAIVLTRPQAEVAASWGQVLVPILLAIMLGLVVAVALVLWTTRRATRPLRDLEQAARRVAQGDLAAEVGEGGAEELDAVARAFNAMVRQLARRDRIAREFLMRVTHDLRTPLTAIRGHALALSDGVVPDDAVPRSLGAIASEANRLEVLVTDLLDLARMDADRFRVNITPVNGADVVRAAADAMSSSARAAGVHLVADIPDLPDVHTDPDRVQQVIGNLIDNAIRWTPPQGTITLSARPRAGGGLVVEVADTGPGVPADRRDEVFEPFRSSEAPGGHVGSGLGLAIGRQLARTLGGDLGVGDAPGGGACFTLLLPARAPDRNDEEPPPMTDGGSPGTSPAVVD
ncbi:MAG: HAMP domain-containing histidine kinase [Thermoleophilia bacterium]|nr:HAMP domain-containing histidine kinase [Thermoleophilia bacterium]